MVRYLLLSILLPLTTLHSATACTAFVVYRNGLALAGNNEDFWLTDTKIWYAPKDGSGRGVAGRFGRVYFGFSNFYPQGGMNEAGLFFDGFATARQPVTQSGGRPRFDGNLSDHVMANCETVGEVIALFEKYDVSFLQNAMLMFSDKHGDSVIVEGDELIRIDGDHQIVTNFYQSQWTEGPCPCRRYQAASEALASGDAVSVEVCREILQATHQAGRAHTQYSNVYDLKNGMIFLYHFHSFGHVVTLDLKQELAKGAHEVDLPDLFPSNPAFEEFKEQRAEQTRRRIESRRATGIDPDALQDYRGTFALDVGQAEPVRLHIDVEGGRVFLRSAESEERQELFAEAEDRLFAVSDYGMWVYQFRRDDQGAASKIDVLLEDLGRRYQAVRISEP